MFALAWLGIKIMLSLIMVAIIAFWILRIFGFTFNSLDNAVQKVTGGKTSAGIVLACCIAVAIIAYILITT